MDTQAPLVRQILMNALTTIVKENLKEGGLSGNREAKRLVL
jgi:hypothetical protein